MASILVRVYKNSRAKNYSIMHGSPRFVIAHLSHLTLVGPIRFIVYEAGRQAVLQRGIKNVHAFIEGYWDQDAELYKDGVIPSPHSVERVTYNPFKSPYFMVEDKPIHTYDGYISLSPLGVYISRSKPQ